MYLANELSGFSDEMAKIAEGPKKAIDVKALKRKIELWSRLKSSTDVPINTDTEAENYGGGYYDNDTKSISTSTHDPESLAHELGHASLDTSMLGRMIQHSINRKMFPWTPVAGAIAGVLAAKGKKWGALLPVATAGPTLLSEWLATRKGAERLEDVGATPQELAAYRKSLSDSFSTYHEVIPQALLAGGAGYLTSSVGS